ncbi:putative transcription factor kapC [Emericellopsis cladophorae]|uniref:Transcription factor kapC n=1 Tax=Emericellopsis cladophorae TaxID=2686198 RepID=A0A9Q0BFE4_9HYPO|nr:putative transcription factor kapC [Emericellopsis cladophorae]KAI6783382.1 putative transcription factor kapC [Emericellopsis cladophorae]
MSSNTGTPHNGQEHDQQLHAQVELLRAENEQRQGTADDSHHSEHSKQETASPQETSSNGFDPTAAAAHDVKRALNRPGAEHQYIHPDLRGQEEAQAQAPTANMESMHPRSEPPQQETTVQHQPQPQQQPQQQQHPQPHPQPHQQQQPQQDQQLHGQPDQHMQQQLPPRQIADQGLQAAAGPNIAPAPPADDPEAMQRWHDGRSRPNRELSQTKRAAQNRAAQMEQTYRQGKIELYRMRQYALHLQARLYDVTGEMPQPPPGLDMAQPEEPPRPMTPEYIRNAKGLEAVARAVAGLEAASGASSEKSEDQEMKDSPGPAAPAQEQLAAQASEA